MLAFNENNFFTELLNTTGSAGRLEEAKIPDYFHPCYFQSFSPSLSFFTCFFFGFCFLLFFLLSIPLYQDYYAEHKFFWGILSI